MALGWMEGRDKIWCGACCYEGDWKYCHWNCVWMNSLAVLRKFIFTLSTERPRVVQYHENLSLTLLLHLTTWSRLSIQVMNKFQDLLHSDLFLARVRNKYTIHVWPRPVPRLFILPHDPFTLRSEPREAVVKVEFQEWPVSCICYRHGRVVKFPHSVYMHILIKVFFPVFVGKSMVIPWIKAIHRCCT